MRPTQGTAGTTRVQCANIENRSVGITMTGRGVTEDASITVMSVVITPQHRRTTTLRHPIADIAIEPRAAPLFAAASQSQSREVFTFAHCSSRVRQDHTVVRLKLLHCKSLRFGCDVH